MAARILSQRDPLSRRPKPSFVREGLSPRTIFFPDGLLSRIDSRPGQLVEVLTDALTRFLSDEKGGVH